MSPPSLDIILWEVLRNADRLHCTSGCIFLKGEVFFCKGTETFFFCKRPGTSPKKVRACGKKNYEEKKIMVGKKKYAGVFFFFSFFFSLENLVLVWKPDGIHFTAVNMMISRVADDTLMVAVRWTIIRWRRGRWGGHGGG